MSVAESSSQEYWLMVVELDDVVPRRDSRLPNLLVAKTISPPKKRLKDIQRSNKPPSYTSHVIRLRSDLAGSKTYQSAEEAKLAYLKLTKKLNSEGYTVNGETRVWTVYVIELDSSAVKDPGKGYVYVGETSRTAEERFKQHIEGARNKHGRLYSQVVNQYGVKLRPDLAPREKFFDQASAKRGERDHFGLLKAQGFNVKGGH